MDRRKYILIFAISIALVMVSVCVYLVQLSNTVAANLMTTVDEISRHDVETIEGSLDYSYARLGSVAHRMEVYDVETIKEAQEQMNLEAASSTMFNAIYLLDDQGNLYSSSYVHFTANEHAYDEIFSDGREHFVMLYDDANGQLETTKESLIYGIRINNMQIEGHTFIAMMGRSDLSIIQDQLLIESFDGQGASSVVNSYGNYIVNASLATDLAGKSNLYDVLESGHIEGGITVEDVRRNISEGKSFVINCDASNGQRLVLSFAPVKGTAWSFIMTVPADVFEQRFAPFILMTAGMLIAVVIVLIIMLVIIYRFMKSSVSANAEAAARSEFLSNMSHEIRTPLNGIIGLNHLMARHLDDKEAMAEHVQKLGITAQYLLALVNDILDVSKLQAGKVELAMKPFDLDVVINNVCEIQREPMEERGIHFELHASDVVYPYLMGDEVRISQVLINILSNAVKFTPREGRITLRATQHHAISSDRVLTTISITDTGCGISEEFQEQIFEVFTQERSSNDDSQKGTGLGMSISYLLAKQMGGTLSVESQLGEGSCFTVVLPLMTDPAHRTDMPVKRTRKDNHALPTQTATSSAVDTPNQPVMRVLVAEDNELNADIISSILTEEGFDVTVTSNGREAVDAFAASAEGWFQAILMDAQMPVMDGYEAAKEIRGLARADAKSVKIFACTASTFTEDRQQALESGMDDFLPKPLNFPVMLQKLEDLRKEG